MAAYDYRVEYISASGTQYIDTQIQPDSNTEWSLDIAGINPGAYSSVYKEYFFGTTSGSVRYEYGFTYSAATTTADRSFRFIHGTSGDDGYDNRINYGSDTSFFSSRHVFSFRNKKDYIDDIQKGSASPTGSISYGLILLGSNRNGTISVWNRPGTPKLYGFKAWKNGSLVISLTPVVKNGVACMYDTVSGNFFYNQGTGSFVAGPRIYEPVTGLPMALAPFGGMGVVNPYVQNGLKMHLDGIWNAGIGVHDPNATTWKDLAGTHDATVNTSCTWNSNSLANSSAVIPAEISDLSDIAFNAGHTIELIFARDTKATRQILFGCYNGVNGISIELFYGNGTNYNVRYYGNSGFYASHDFDSKIPTQVGVPIHFAVTKSVSGSTRSFQFYGNGNKTYLGTNTSDPTIHNIFRIGCDNSRTNFAFFGKFYAIRVYDRALTDAEISQNYNIDKQRFGI